MFFSEFSCAYGFCWFFGMSGPGDSAIFKPWHRSASTLKLRHAGVYIEGAGLLADWSVSHSALPAPWGWVTSDSLKYKELRHE